MSKLKTNTIRHVDGSNDNITLDSSQNVTAENNLTVDGNLTVSGTSTISGYHPTTSRSNRNILINGDMKIAQRGTSGDVAAGGSNIYACVDRWKTQIQTGTVTLSQESTGTSDAPYQKGHRKYLRVKNKTGVDANDGQYIQLDHYIEAQDIAACGWDYRDSNSKITLSFWVRSSIAQKFGGFLLSFDGTQRLHAFEITNNGNALTADTWTKISKTFGGNSGITIDDNNDMGLRVTLVPFYGANNTTSDVSLTDWGATNTSAWVRDMTTTWATTTNATFDFTGVQLEVGDTATDFEHRSFGDELARCQRYFYKEHVTDSIGPYFTQYYHSHKFVHMWYPVTMRTVPTPTVTYNTGSPTAYKLTTNHFKAYVASAYDDSSNTYYISAAQFDAEL